MQGWVSSTNAPLVVDVLFHLLCDAQRALVAFATPAEPGGRIGTQGHVLTVPDFMATLATEAAIHHLDLTVNLAGAVEPEPAAFGLAVATLDGLLSVARPPEWTETEFLLKATGRSPLSATDRTALGEAAGTFPVLS
jgi:hypothetical protein